VGIVFTIGSEMKVNRLTRKTQGQNREGRGGESLRGTKQAYFKGGVRKKCPRRAQTGSSKEAELD